MPVLNWIGKEKVITHHNDVPYHTLKRTYSFDENGQHKEDNGSENMIIHGDNLIALKALLPTYEGRVNCIYIDPPYNTGNEGWVYNDNVNDPRIKKWLNQVVGKEGEDLSRHDKWLCMMYPRLQLLKKLLHPVDGAIFISIDDNEYAPLKLICDEIFGLTNHVATIVWQKRYSRENREAIGDSHEYIACYAMNPERFKTVRNFLPLTDKQTLLYKNPDKDPRGPWQSVSMLAQGYRPNQMYTITSDNGIEHVPPPGNCWRHIESEFLKLREDNRIYFGPNGNGVPRKKVFLSEAKGLVPWTWWPHTEVGHTDEAKKEIIKIFGTADTFDTPKPSRLISQILHIASHPNDIVLDCFAGSGTTAEVVLALNHKDNGNRRFICIEMMGYADSITAERAKRAIQGYASTKDEQFTIFDKELKASDLTKGAELLQEAKDARKEAQESGEYDSVAAPKLVDNHLQVIAKLKGSDEIKGTGGNFSFYELGAPVIDEDGFNPSLTEEEKKAYIWQTETRTKYVPLDDDSDGCLGIRDGQAVYLFHDEENGEVFNRQSLCRMKHRADNYVVYADACTFSEEELDRMNIVFRKIPRDVVTK